MHSWLPPAPAHGTEAHLHLLSQCSALVTDCEFKDTQTTCAQLAEQGLLPKGAESFMAPSLTGERGAAQQLHQQRQRQRQRQHERRQQRRLTAGMSAACRHEQRRPKRCCDAQQQQLSVCQVGISQRQAAASMSNRQSALTQPPPTSPVPTRRLVCDAAGLRLWLR